MKPQPPFPDDVFEDPSEGRGSLRQRSFAILAIFIAFGLIAYGIKFAMGITPPAKKSQSMQVVPVQLPPPPPPPPPKQEEPPPDDRMIEAEPDMDEETDRAEAAPDNSALGTGIVGDGPPDAFGLSAGGGRGFFGSRSPAQRDRRWARFSSSMQSSITEAVRRHPTLRQASLSAEVRVWADPTGQITRAHVSMRDQVDPELKAILRDEVLTGLRLQSAPPEDMPMPVVMRLTARRPD